MASVRINSPNVNRRSELFRNFKSIDDSRIFTENMKLAFRFMVDEEIDNHFVDLSMEYIEKLVTTYTNICSYVGRSQFREAGKRHKSTINELIQAIISSVTVGNTFISDYRESHSQIIIMIEGDVPIVKKVKPRSFRKLYEILRHVIKISETQDQLLAYLKLLSTLANVYTDIRLDDQEMDVQAEEDISNIAGNPVLVSEDEILKDSSIPGTPIYEILETASLIVEYVNSRRPIRDIPPWARTFVQSLRKCKRMDFKDIKFKESTSSSGTKLLKKRKWVTVPAILASLYEPDTWHNEPCIQKFDQMFGFPLHYTEELDTKAKTRSKERFCCMIEQKKPKGRLIHPLANPAQDRLTLLEEIDNAILYNLEQDCTKDQKKGPWIITTQMKRNPERAIYSMDLKDATNTMSLVAQLLAKRIIYSLWYTPEEVDTLLEAQYFLMTRETSIRLHNRKRIKFRLTSGQPMGYYDSFKSFSLLHHLVEMTTFRMIAPNANMVDEGYRVLGDDTVAFLDDPDCKYPDTYIHYINAVNVVCNKDKGYLYNQKVPGMNKPIAEFAKYLIINGYDMTAIPIKLMVGTSLESVIGMTCWLQEHHVNSLKSLDYLLSFVGQLPTATSIVVDYLRALGSLRLKSLVNNSFPCQKVLDSFVNESHIYLLLGEIRNNLNLSCILNYFREDNSTDNITDFIHVKGYKDINSDIITNAENGKLHQTKIWEVYNYLEELSVFRECGIETLFGDQLFDNVEEEVLLAFPIISYIKDNVRLTSLIEVIDILDGKLQVSDLGDHIVDVYHTCLDICNIVCEFERRSWTSYANKLTSTTYLDQINSFYDIEAIKQSGVLMPDVIRTVIDSSSNSNLTMPISLGTDQLNNTHFRDECDELIDDEGNSFNFTIDDLF